MVVEEERKDKGGGDGWMEGSNTEAAGGVPRSH